MARAALRSASGQGARVKLSVQWEERGDANVLSIRANQPVFTEANFSSVDRFRFRLMQRRAIAMGAAITIEQDGTAMEVVVPPAQPQRGD
jgi:hypothetical protein